MMLSPSTAPPPTAPPCNEYPGLSDLDTDMDTALPPLSKTQAAASPVTLGERLHLRRHSRRFRALQKSCRRHVRYSYLESISFAPEGQQVTAVSDIGLNASCIKHLIASCVDGPWLLRRGGACHTRLLFTQPLATRVSQVFCPSGEPLLVDSESLIGCRGRHCHRRCAAPVLRSSGLPRFVASRLLGAIDVAHPEARMVRS